MRDALIASLKAHAGLTAALGGASIHDGAVRGARYPHVALGGVETGPWDTQTSRGEEHIVTLHVWSRSTNAAQAQDILARLADWADSARPVLPGRRLVTLRNIFWSALNAPEAGLYHGVMRLRIVTEI